jgi:hypothetical protein
MTVLELVIADAIKRAKKRVPPRGLPRLERQRTLIREALTHIGWEPSFAQRDADAFTEGHWEQYVREFAPEWDRARKPAKGDILWGAKVYKLTWEQFDLLLSDEPLASARLAHLAVRMFIAIHRELDGSVHRALFWSALPATAIQHWARDWEKPLRLWEGGPLLPGNFFYRYAQRVR